MKIQKYIYVGIIISFITAVFIIKNNLDLFKDKKITPDKLKSPVAINKNLSANLPVTRKIKLEITVTPTASPTSTIKPEPTQPLTGFCLNVPILIYHHVQPSSVAKEKGQTAFTVDNGFFDQQMRYLTSRGYTTITARQLIDALRNHTQLPAKSVMVTLDDGYKDAYEYVYPILQKYHITANLMIPTGLLEGPDYLTWGQIEEMYKSGLIYYTDHTWSHYALGRGNTEKIKYEVVTAKQQLEQRTGQRVDIFTYPYGSFTDSAIKILQDEGFVGAFSTIPGFWQCDSFIMTLHRNRIGNASLSYYGL